MPAFANPFSGNIDRKISKTELVQALRVDIASELEAIYLYDAHAHATDDPVAQKVLMDIRDEEVQHVGELMTLMRYLDPSVASLMQEGEQEVMEMMEELNISKTKIQKAVESSVGSLLDKE